MDFDKLMMNRAMDLARLGKGFVSPNPMVGCVIAWNGKIIGEGYHQKYGHSHAEVNAINSVRDKSLLSKSTLYVNLEPCIHFGKTPPCSDLLIRSGIKKVVIANQDSSSRISGKGISKLRNEGVEVVTDILYKEGRDLNKRFFTFVEEDRPYTILKWAETADGFMARENFDSKWISNVYSRQQVHKWRAQEDAVMVGTRTALHDNPTLNVRLWHGSNPFRVVIDRKLCLPRNLNLFDGTQHTICYNLKKTDSFNNLTYIKVEEENFTQNIATDIVNRNIQSILIEGGAVTLNSWIENGLWDEARIFRSPKTFRKGLKAPSISGYTVSDKKIFDDNLVIIRNSSKKVAIFK